METDLAAGLWPKFLPGERVLAARYGVSRPTIEEAVKGLAERGLITGGGPRCRWRVNPEAVGTAAPAQPAAAEVLLWLGEDHPSADVLTSEVMEATRRAWEARGGIMEVVVMDLQRIRNPAAAIRKLVERHTVTRMILHNAPEPLARAACATGLPVFLHGGEIVSSDLPGIGFSLKLVLGGIIPALVSAGRQRILMAIPAGLPSWHETMVSALRKSGAACAEDPVSWVLEVPQNLPQAVHDLWRRVLPAKRPDAVFLMDARWVISLYAVAGELGIRPGTDIEVIYFDDAPQLDWLIPPPRALRVSARVFVKRIEKWLRHPESSGGFTLVGISKPRAGEP